MSTDIKPGQVWAWKDTSLALGPHGTQFEITTAGFDNAHYQYPHAAGFNPDQTYGAARDLIAANAVLIKDPTPAPLDPSKVKAGDTLRRKVGFPGGADLGMFEGRLYTVATVDAENDLVTFAGMRFAGRWEVENFELVTRATDHQPAPEPEPVLPTKPGSLIRSAAGDLTFLTKAMWIDQDHDERNPVAWVAPWTQMVVIDPERARALVRDHFDDDRSRALLDALLDGAS